MVFAWNHPKVNPRKSTALPGRIGSDGDRSTDTPRTNVGGGQSHGLRSWAVMRSIRAWIKSVLVLCKDGVTLHALYFAERPSRAVEWTGGSV